MSGTYSIDGVLLTENPGVKQWRFDAGRRRKGNGVGQQPPFFSVDWEFPPLAVGTGTTLAFLAEKYNSEDKHAVVMGHPSTGYLTIFSGVTIDAMTYQLGDINNDGWAQGVKLTLGHISTGNMYPIEKQSYWWFGNNRDYVVSLSGTQNASGTELQLTVSLVNNDKYSLVETITSIPLPTNLTYSSSVGNGSFDDTTNEWTLSGLDGGDTASIVITYAISTANYFTFTATVNAKPYGNYDVSNDTDTVTIYPWWLADGVETSYLFGAYNAVDAASYADSLVNRNAAGTGDLTTGVTPSWDTTNGWDFTGSEYLASSFYPKQEMTVIVKYSGISVSYNVEFLGGGHTPSQFLLATGYTTTSDIRNFGYRHVSVNYTAIEKSGSNNSGTLTFVSSAFASGSSSKKLYLNGSEEFSRTESTEYATPAQVVFIGAYNNDGTAIDFFHGYINAVAIYNTELTEIQIATITSNMESLF